MHCAGPEGEKGKYGKRQVNDMGFNVLDEVPKP